MDRSFGQSDEARQIWLKSILLKYGRRIFERCGYFYARLSRLPRATRRRLQAAAGTSLSMLALALALSGAPAVYAATITVDGTTCTLADAITAANTDGAAGGCATGSGSDILDLQTDVTLAGALPQITTNVTINGNSHTIDGGGSYQVFDVGASGDLTVNAITISGGDSDTDGGGILNAGTLRVSNSTISGNSSAGYGGGIENSGGTLIVNNSTFTGNSASYGGAIENSGIVTIANSTFSGNMATGGGAIASQGILTATNSTFTGNTASAAAGGAILNANTLTLSYSLVSGNSSSMGAEIFSNNVINVDSYNVFGHSGLSNAQAFSGFTPGTNDITATSNGDIPMALGGILNTTLANNGGPTFTHALVPGSPALDVVPNGASGATDQRGFGRDFDSYTDANTTNLGDAGAFESQVPLVITLSYSGAETADSPGGATAVLSALLLSMGTAWATLRRRRFV